MDSGPIGFKISLWMFLGDGTLCKSLNLNMEAACSSEKLATQAISTWCHHLKRGLT
jgi:hypothetical protein